MYINGDDRRIVMICCYIDSMYGKRGAQIAKCLTRLKQRKNTSSDPIYS